MKKPLYREFGSSSVVGLYIFSNSIGKIGAVHGIR